MEKEINVEEIMEEIRKNIQERGYDKEPLSFEDVQIPHAALQGDVGYNADEFIYELNYLNHNWNNNIQVPIVARNAVTNFIKKLIRKCTQFIIFPIVNFQNAYNVSNVRCLNQVKEYIAEMECYKQRIEQLEKEIKELKRNTENEGNR